MDIKELIQKMTLEEKIGQLQQCGPSIVGTFGVSFEELLDMMFDGRITKREFEQKMASSEQDYHEESIRAGLIGSLNGITGAELCDRLQRIAVEESRLGIPLLFGADVIHGFRTVFPIPLAQSCSWNPALVGEASRVSAAEASAVGLHWTFSPMLDIARDARWGRIAEGYGEDPLLASDYARAVVEGYQGESLSAPDSLLACAKHFVGYGAAESGRDYNTTSISEGVLHDVYLPPFAAAVEAGCQTIMPAFNELNGIPCCVNTGLLRDTLRGELGFDGMLVSDSNAIAECVSHGVAQSKADAAALALRAGVDMDMSSNSYVETLAGQIAEGTLPVDLLDEAVYHVLEAKRRKGLFENPYSQGTGHEAQALLKPEYRRMARALAAESMVLLKNDGALPLAKGEKLLLAGELADDNGQLLGTWAINGVAEDVIGIRQALEESTETHYMPLCSPTEEAFTAPQQVPSVSDTVIVVAGETKEMSGEAASRADIRLPGNQAACIRWLAEHGKRVVLVLVSGRPLDLTDVEPYCAAVLAAWHPGIEAGPALCMLLFGEQEPTGRLTASFPAGVGQCPIYYNHPPTGRPAGKSKFTSKYLDLPAEPLYPFGFGLGYTSFRYGGLCVEINGDILSAQVTVTNEGDRTGTELVQLYMHDKVAAVVQPVKRLLGYRKVNIQAGASAQVVFEIPTKQLGYHVLGTGYTLEPGEFEIFVGGNSRDTLSVNVTLGFQES